jgi:hypothetical protein
MDERVVLTLAQKKSYWRTVSIRSHVTFVPAYIRIELAEMLVTEIGDRPGARESSACAKRAQWGAAPSIWQTLSAKLREMVSAVNSPAASAELNGCSLTQLEDRESRPTVPF